MANSETKTTTVRYVALNPLQRHAKHVTELNTDHLQYLANAALCN